MSPPRPRPSRVPSPRRPDRRHGSAAATPARPDGRGGDLRGAGGVADHTRRGGVLGSANPERRRAVRRHRGSAGGLAGGPGRHRDQGHRSDPAAGRHRGDPQRGLRRRHHRAASAPAARRAAVGSHQRSRRARGPRVHRLRRVRRVLGAGQHPSPGGTPSNPDRRRLRCRVAPGRPGRARRRRGHRPGQGTAGGSWPDHRRERPDPRDRPTDRADGRAPAAAGAHDLRVQQPRGQVAAAHRRASCSWARSCSPVAGRG